MKWMVMFLVVFAGCAAPVVDGRDPLRASAQELLDEPNLIAVFGFDQSDGLLEAQVECLQAATNSQPSFLAHIYTNPTDGRVLFADHDYGFLCASSLEPLRDVLPPIPQVLGPDLTSWKLSAQQARAALFEDEKFIAMSEACPVSYALIAFDDGPVWTLYVLDPVTRLAGAWSVHADHGRIVEPKQFGQPLPCDAPTQTGSANGQTSGRLVAGVEAHFAMAAIHDELAFRIQSEDPLAQQGLSYGVAITYPDGTTLDGTARNGATLEPGPALSGSYSVKITSNGEGGSPFQVTYCGAESCAGEDW